MELIDNPIQEPGTCFICDATNHGGYVDTLNNFDYGPAPYMNGRKYVCRPCVVEMATLFGFQPPEAIAVLKGDLAAAQIELREVQGKLHLQEVLVEAISSLSLPAVAVVESTTSTQPVPDTGGQDDSASVAPVADAASPADRSPAPKKPGRPKKVVK